MPRVGLCAFNSREAIRPEGERMPNGRTGGFFLKPAEFEKLLERHVGEMVVGETKLEVPVTAAEVARSWSAAS